jgi:predicted ATPase/DNA-binding winged helix-turn-helix (wHTH) protein
MKHSPLESVSFGPFQLYPAARAIEKNGAAMALGSRALDILIVLVERAGEIVSHKELISRAWRGLQVEPGNLRVHMTALRKALGDGQASARYIENVTGQGYCFVAPIKRTNASDAEQTASLSPSIASRTLTAPMRSLPPALARMIGRDDSVRTIAADLRADRFVTITGPGGMGKTTVAVSVAHAMLEEFAGNVCFVDLGAITDPKLLIATVASTLGLTIQSVEAVVSLMAFLQRTRMLLVLDNCEHVINAVAELAETVFSQAPEVHILATSREALRVEGEHAHLLRPLGAPPPDTHPNAKTALTFPAVNLFVERAVMSDRHFALTDANAQLVSDICARLDGIALALEFVAGRIGTYGLEGTADLLKRRLGLHWQGRRTALPRHQTLHSLLEWSYGLLPESEQHVLRRLAIFVGPFTLEAAQAVASDTVGDAAQLTEAVDQLIAKSLVSTVRTPEGRANFRLLETTRLYGMRKLEESGERDATAERHARHFVQLLKSSSTERGTTTHLGNLRAALEWCFHDRSTPETLRDSEVSIDLATVCAPVFMDLSLWDECRKWSELALVRLDDSMRGDQRELILQEALAISSLLINEDDARTAICRGLEIAQRIGETAIRLRLLGALHVYRLRMTDFEGALAVAEEMDGVAKSAGDVSYRVIADWMLGSAHFVLGHPETSRQLFESGFLHGGPDAGRGEQVGGLYYRTRALYGLARVQWLCGYPDRALRTARQAIVEAAATGSPFNISYSLVYCCYIFLWCGDLDAAQEMIDKVMALPHWQGRLVWFHAEALALKGELLIRRGNVEDGIELLIGVLTDMRASRQKNLMQTVTACCLAEGLTAAGRTAEALAVIDDAITHSPGGTETWDGPELLRVRAAILLSMPGTNAEQAEASVLHALACARGQGARGWELRTTVTLAQLRVSQGRAAEARALLSAIYEPFTEGFATRDLTIAVEMLRDLDRDLGGSSGSVARSHPFRRH